MTTTLPLLHGLVAEIEEGEDDRPAAPPLAPEPPACGPGEAWRSCPCVICTRRRRQEGVADRA